MSTTISGLAGCSLSDTDSVATVAIQDEAVTWAKLEPAIVADSMRMVVMPTETVGAAVTYVDFLNLPTYVATITISFSGFQTGDASSPIIQVGTSAGIETSGYTSSSCAINSATPTTATAATTGLVINSILAANVLYGSYTLTKLDNNRWVGSGTHQINSTGHTFSSGQTPILATELEKIRITTLTAATNLTPGGIIGVTYGGPL